MPDRAARAAHRLLTLAGVGLLAGTALRVLATGPPAPGRLAGACGAALVPRPTVAWVATVVLAGVVAVSLAGMLRGILDVRRARRHVRGLPGTRRRLLGTSVVVVPTERVIAFCAGLRRPRVHLSSAAVSSLDHGELRAVLAHELHHARRRDPLRMAVRHVVARALFFLPVVKLLGDRLDELAERDADTQAIRAAGGDRRALAGALLRFDAAGAPGGAGISPARVDWLTGAAAPWALPARQVGGAVLALAGLLAVALASASMGAAAAAALHVCLGSIAVLGVLGSPLAAVVRRRGG